MVKEFFCGVAGRPVQLGETGQNRCGLGRLVGMGRPELAPFSIICPYNARGADVRVGSWPAAVEAAGMSRHAKGKSSKPKRPKTMLGIPDLDHSKSAVLDSLRSPESKAWVSTCDR